MILEAYFQILIAFVLLFGISRGLLYIILPKMFIRTFRDNREWMSLRDFRSKSFIYKAFTPGAVLHIFHMLRQRDVISTKKVDGLILWGYHGR